MRVVHRENAIRLIAAALSTFFDLQTETRTENERLLQLCRKQQSEIEDLNELADCKETLREIGKAFGCDHVESPDERRQLVNCAEQQFLAKDAEIARLKTENDDLVDQAMSDQFKREIGRS